MNRGNRTEEATNYYFRNRERILQKTKEYNKRPDVIARSKEYQKQYFQKVKVKKELARLKRLQEDLKNKPEIIALLAKEDDSDLEQKADWKEEPEIDWASLEIPDEPDRRGKSTHQRTGGKGGRPPRPYYATSKYKDEDDEEFAMTDYVKNRLAKICPQGFYQRPPGEDPFKVNFL